MNNPLVLLILTLIVYTGCSPYNSMAGEPCNTLRYNNFRSINEQPFVIKSQNDSLVLNEVRFECVKRLLAVHKSMFDNYRKWNRIIYQEANKTPILIWDDIQLFPKDTTKFIVLSYGTESVSPPYSALMVFNNDVDYLSNESKYKEDLINLFTKFLKSNNTKDKAFFEAFWQETNPEHWEKIKDNFKN